MNKHVVAYLVGKISYCISLALFLPILVAFFYKEAIWLDFLFAALLGSLAGYILKGWGEKGDIETVTIREGISMCFFTWLLASSLCALPFYLSGTMDWPGAFFESMSGLTTTGATVLTDIEASPKALLFWRSLTHWIGGIGIIVIFVALLPQMGGNAMNMMNAEVSGFTSARILPRMRTTAVALLIIYLIMTTVLTGILMLLGLNLYDAINHAFATIATGGYSPYNNSIAHFNSAAVEFVIGVFMVLSGANFALYYEASHSGLKVLWKDVEFKAYLAYLGVLILLITINICMVNNYSPLFALRHAFFQVTSFASTTGFASFDYDQWPAFSKLLLVVTYLVGGCAGSTAGGIKVCRFVVLLKTVGAELKRALHPNMLLTVYYGGKRLPIPTILSISRFFFIYVLILVVLSGVAATSGLPFDECLFGVGACLSSVGPAFGAIGATGNYSELEPIAKFAMATAMLLGRLELFTVLALLRKEYWRKTKRW